MPVTRSGSRLQRMRFHPALHILLSEGRSPLLLIQPVRPWRYSTKSIHRRAEAATAMAGYAVRSFENGDLQRLVEIEAASTAMLAAHGCPQLFQEEPSTPRRSCFGCLPIRLLRRCCQGRNHRRICLGARTGRHFLARRNGCRSDIRSQGRRLTSPCRDDADCSAI